MTDKTKKRILIAVALSVSLLITYFVSKSIFGKDRKLKEECEKRKGTWDSKTKKCNFEGDSGDTSGGNTGGNTGGGGNDPFWNGGSTTTYNPAGDVAQLHSYIGGANFFDYQDEIQSIFDGLTDEQLKVLDAEWRRQHNGESLWYWLDDELDQCGTFGIFSMENCYESPMKRLKNLGLV